MAYFPNGTSGEMYEETYCAKCAHSNFEDQDGPMCPVWTLHMLFNYEDGDVKTCLDILIPMDDEGLYPKECKMFIERRS